MLGVSFLSPLSWGSQPGGGDRHSRCGVGQHRLEPPQGVRLHCKEDVLAGLQA